MSSTTDTTIHAAGHYGTVGVDVIPNPMVDNEPTPSLIRVTHSDECQEVEFHLAPDQAVRLALRILDAVKAARTHE